MASLTQWTWVWVNSGSWWWTGRPGVLQFMGSQRVGHDWITELNWCIFYLGSHAMSPPSTYTVKMLVTQPYPTLCDPINCSPPRSSVHEILEWVVILFSGDFLPQEPNPGLLHCGQILYLLSPHGNPYIFTGVLLSSCSQSFSRLGLLLFFRIFSLFCLIVGLPSVPGKWYKAMKQTW